jgi:4-amino-4-deoxy-L-arabinose transferase-like glycosyltransferase
MARFWDMRVHRTSPRRLHLTPMPPYAPPTRPRSTLLTILLLWIAFYASFTLFIPPLLDDADSVHVEVAREMLLRHDYVTLYANGIRYLEKAPLLYWSMALCMKLASLFGITSPTLLAAAARLPLALAVLALVLAVEAFARRLFGSPESAANSHENPAWGESAGLYAALILLSSFGIFIFTRITIPDAGVCLFTTLAMLCFWRTEELEAGLAEASHLSRQHHPRLRWISFHPSDRTRLYCGGFAAACALNVLTKGLIGVVFPVGIVLIYMLLTRGVRNAARRLRELHPLASLEAFLLLAAPWHILAGLANPTEGHPTPFRFVNHHWIVPLPTFGNVHGWFWFYFMNEHLLRYLNLRIPHDYDTSPLWLFWGLCFVWIMPWSAFIFKVTAWAVPWRSRTWRESIRGSDPDPWQRGPLFYRGLLLLIVWAAFVLLFFAFSTRQEYYVLPALPAVAILLAGWFAQEFQTAPTRSSEPDIPLSVSSRPEPERRGAGAERSHPLPSSSQVTTPGAPFLRGRIAHGWGSDTARAALRCTAVLLVLGAFFAAFAVFVLLHATIPPPGTDLATLLQQHPTDYALSMGHFLDLDTRALGLFHLPLILSAVALFCGPLAALILRLRNQPHRANLALFAASFLFLLAADLGFQTFSPVLSSALLARAVAPQVRPNDLIAIHGEYESGSSLAFYLHRPSTYPSPPSQYIHILEGRSSNLWYGSFFTDSPPIFETPQSIAQKWASPQRVFLWQSLTDPPNQLPPLPGPVYVLVKSGGKEIVSNQPNR